MDGLPATQGPDQWILVHINDKAVPHATRQGKPGARHAAWAVFNQEALDKLRTISPTAKQDGAFFLINMPTLNSEELTTQLTGMKFFSGWSFASPTKTDDAAILEALKEPVAKKLAEESGQFENFRLFLETRNSSKDLYDFLTKEIAAAFAIPCQKKVEAKTLSIHVALGNDHAYISFGPEGVIVRTQKHFPIGAKILLARFGEVFIKGNNRDQLIAQMRSMVVIKIGRLGQVKGDNVQFAVCPNKPEDFDTCLDILRSIPGLDIVLTGVTCGSTTKEILECLVKHLEAKPFNSCHLKVVDEYLKLEENNLKKVLVYGIAEHFGKTFANDKTEHDIEVRVLHQVTYVSTTRFQAIGGLPVFKNQTVVSLLSGGIDSPVASFLMMKRGCSVVLVHYQNHTQMQTAVEDKIVRIAKQLSKFQHSVTLYIVPFAGLQSKIISVVPSRDRMLVYRRFMTMVGTHVAKQHGAMFLVLGDAFSSVASQTIVNLEAIYKTTETPILAPLMGLNKQEVVTMARSIGTLELSNLPYGDCCSYFLDKHPNLHLRGEKVYLQDYLGRLDCDELCSTALSQARILRILSKEGEVTMEELQAMTIPELDFEQQQQLEAAQTCKPRSNDEAGDTSPVANPPLAVNGTPTNPEAPTKKEANQHPPVIRGERTFSPKKAAVKSKPIPSAAPTSVALPPNPKGEIYLDNAATTQIDPAVLNEMLPHFTMNFGNPASSHALGEQANHVVDRSRKVIASCLKAETSNIIFTSGGTESNSLAILGYCQNVPKKTTPFHILTTVIEHESVLGPFRYLEKNGFSVTYLPVNSQGLVEIDRLAAALKPETIFVSVGHANNEIGAVQDIAAIAKECAKRNIVFHTDAVQSFTKVPIDVNEIPIGLMTLNSHKIHGPKGSGALYIRPGVQIAPLVHGGGHELGIRSGTVNVPGVVGFSSAVTFQKPENLQQMASLVQLFNDKLKEKLGKHYGGLNGPALGTSSRLCNLLSVWWTNGTGDGLMKFLSTKGIYCSTGSACSSHSSVQQPSHVLLALGLTPQRAQATSRFSVSRFTTEQDIETCVNTIAEYFQK